MPLPSITAEGLLPPGVHECSLEEAQAKFGYGNNRSTLWSKLLDYLDRVREAGIFSAVLIDGSFITASEDVCDIDVALVIEEFSPDQTATLKMFTSEQVVQEFKEDFSVVSHVSTPLPFGENYFEWFQNVRPEYAWQHGGPERARKGILLVRL